MINFFRCLEDWFQVTSKWESILTGTYSLRYTSMNYFRFCTCLLRVHFLYRYLPSNKSGLFICKYKLASSRGTRPDITLGNSCVCCLFLNFLPPYYSLKASECTYQVYEYFFLFHSGNNTRPNIVLRPVNPFGLKLVCVFWFE